jgi:hypothetical protein
MVLKEMNLVFSKVDSCLGRILLGDRFDEEARGPDIILVVDAEASFVAWEHHIMRSKRQCLRDDPWGDARIFQTLR